VETHENVLVVGEVDRGRLSSLTVELLGIGARLAGDLHQDLHLVHLGAEIPPVLEQAYGGMAPRGSTQPPTHCLACTSPISIFRPWNR
jgi:hypothetical protein